MSVMTKTKGTCLTVSPLTKTKQILYELMLREFSACTGK